MRKVFAWLGVAMSMVILAPASARAQASEPLKPYVVFIMDTSGSMDSATGAGPTTCGFADTRRDHAKCAVNNIVNSYGDMVFALGRFRMTMGGGPLPGTPCTLSGAGSAGSATCNGTDDMFELLTPLVDGNNELAARWTDGTINTCTAVGTDPEIWETAGNTPIAGSLVGVKDYWLGNQSTNFTIWPNGQPGFDPIVADTTNQAFLARPGTGTSVCDSNINTCNNAGGCMGPNCCCLEQCRPYIVIMLTDGDETCVAFDPNATNAATSLLTTDEVTMGATRRYRVETKAIALGKPAPDPEIEALAHAGGTPDDGNAATLEGFYAQDEAQLQLAISQILDDAIRTEVCNTLDDDCDSIPDEGFSTGGACDNGRLGVCRVNGTGNCRADGTGVECSAGIGPTTGPPNCPACGCVAKALNDACTVMNSANVIMNGTCQAGNPQFICVPTAATGINPADPADNEIPTGCNNLDDDCDGLIDENVAGCACIPSTEICDGLNNDCDLAIDEGTSVPCGTGVCLGTRACTPTAGCDPSPTCSTGNCCLAACDADVPTTEICNGDDDDCDGNADGFQQACSNMQCPGGTCTGGTPTQPTCVGGTRAGLRCGTSLVPFDPTNNPGGQVGSPCDVLGAACICNPGNQTCPLNGSGTFSACVQEVEPRTEICNLLDDDCDGLVDETPQVACTTSAQCPPITPTCDNNTCVPADCSINSCGGELLCMNGVQMCTQIAGVDDTCNGIDEDCDGMVDDEWQCMDPDGPDNDPLTTADNCPCTTPGQCRAQESCQNGSVVCMGDPVAQESCNCADDNCNGIIDEGALCGAGATCTAACQCAFACSPGEFPCPMGKTCLNNFCIADPCFGFSCPVVPGDLQKCRPLASNPSIPECVSACDPSVITCTSPNICFTPTGECKPDDCTTFPDRCTATETCINGTCMGNPCSGVTCASGQYCNGGQCYGSCAGVDCPDGERCRLGACVLDPCGMPCPFGEACNDSTGECVDDQCGFVVCPQGQFCNPNNNGMCEDDACKLFGIQCAEGEVCKGGTCFDEADFRPDAGVEQHVTAGGGGGCSTSGRSGSTTSVLLGLGLVLRLRRRREGGAA